MKRFVILLLWLAVGFIYFTQKEKCCDRITSEVPTTIESETSKSIIHDSLPESDMRMNYIIGSVFSKSSAELKTGYFDDGLKSIIEDSLANGRTIVITGYSYADENDPEELALARAESIRDGLDIDQKLASLKTEFIDTSHFKTNRLFANYQFVVADNEMDATAKIESSQNPRHFLFYIDTLENNSLDSLTLLKLEEIANRIGNSFCTVQLSNGHSNQIYGQSLTYKMEEALIRYGMSPGRVNTFKLADSGKDDNYIELIIKQ